MSPLRRLSGIAALTLAILPLPLTETVHAAAPPASSGASYVVKDGDYLVGIAGKMKVKLSDLLAANGLELTSVIVPGQQLVVPSGGVVPGSVSTPAAPLSYTVQNGDFLFGIASRMNVKPAQLLAANKLELTSVIVPGQKLIVPDGGVVPADLPQTSTASAALTVTATTTATATTPPSATQAPATQAPAAPNGGGKVDSVVAYAQAQVGKGYKFFSAGPDVFDCSGLVTAAYKQVGLNLPQYSGLQATYGTAVDWHSQPIQAGDLVFTYQSGANPTVIGHVGIATSSTRWVQAAGSSTGVIAGALPADGRILAVRRIVS